MTPVRSAETVSWTVAPTTVPAVSLRAVIVYVITVPRPTLPEGDLVLVTRGSGFTTVVVTVGVVLFVGTRSVTPGGVATLATLPMVPVALAATVPVMVIVTDPPEGRLA